MKQLKTSLLAASVAVASLSAPFSAYAIDLREHRGLYTSPYLAEWPSSAIKTSNAEQHKKILRKNLDKLKAQNINAVYYHVRSMCDATYKSKYEPWSKGVSGTRGVEPAFDPLEVVLEEAHARGIEVYAWFNPYRYCGVYDHTDTPLNYTNTHPEWLIVQSGKETILNPALEEVQQRIVDVVLDVVENYDVDGVIFDDYFYSNPTPMSLDADLYEAAKEADPSVGTQIQWRVANVNKMVARVHDAIKAAKPYVAFGISPAGVASPPHVTTEYGLDPAPDSDWQYSSIASDPLAWYKAHTVDFMSPQIYWPTKYTTLENWWAIAARKFGRHLYSAISLSDYSTYGHSEYNNEILTTRSILPDNESGYCFFGWQSYLNNSSRVDGVLSSFGDLLAADANSQPALMPIRPWNNVYAPAMTANVHREDATLVWDEVPGMRYTVYSFAPGEEPRTLGSSFHQVVYTNSYEIPEGYSDHTFGVCVYDRYGNEYSMLLEGATPSEGTPVQLTYPAKGEKAADLFDFTWQDAGCDYMVEVATDADFTDLIASVPTSNPYLSSFSLASLEEGKTYYWRVRSHPVNATATVSEVSSFIASKIALTGPEGTEVAEAPVITWTPAYEGATYLVEIGRTSSFSKIEYTAETDQSQLQIPEGALNTGFTYYARVTATRDGRSSTSDVTIFKTADATYDAPAFINPQAAGTEIHSNEAISIAPWIGMDGVVIQICATDGFAVRSSYKATLGHGETSTPELGSIKIASKALVDGQTYYVRTYGNYYTQATGSTLQTTDYNVSTFVYNATEGVSSVCADDDAVSISADGILSLPVVGCTVEVYAADGSLLRRIDRAGLSADLSSLPAGISIIRVSGPTAATLKWAK